MYRQQSRMAGVQVPDSTNGMHLKFVERVTNLPAVNIACNLAFQTYRNIKTSNRLLNITLNTAEKAGSFVTQQSLPVIRKFENQIKAVDSVACRGLQNLEGIAPVITKQPDEVLSYSRHRCNETIQNGLNKLTTSKNYVRDLVDGEKQRIIANLSILLSTPPGRAVVQLSDCALDELEAYLDYRYPPAQDEELRQLLDPQSKLPPWTRAINLVKTLETRVSMKFDQDLQEAKQLLTNAHSNIVNFDLTKSVDEFLSSPLGSLLLKSVDSAFDQAECYIDHYLPPLGDEGSDRPFGDREMLPAWRRADMLSNTLKERIYKHVMLQLQKLQLRSRETASRLKNLHVVQVMCSVTHSSSTFLVGSVEYASSMYQFVFNFSEATNSHRQPIARLCDLARAALGNAVETARTLSSHPELMIHTVMFHQAMFFRGQSN